MGVISGPQESGLPHSTAVAGTQAGRPAVAVVLHRAGYEVALRTAVGAGDGVAVTVTKLGEVLDAHASDVAAG